MTLTVSSFFDSRSIESTLPVASTGAGSSGSALNGKKYDCMYVNLKRLVDCVSKCVEDNSGIGKKEIELYSKYVMVCKSDYKELKDSNVKYNRIDNNQLVLLERKILFIADLLIREQTKANTQPGLWNGVNLGPIYNPKLIKEEENLRSNEFLIQLKSKLRIEQETRDSIYHLKNSSRTREGITSVEYSSQMVKPISKINLKDTSSESISESKEQEILASEIAVMAAQLKENAHKIQEAIKKDGKILEEAELSALKNKDKLTLENLNLKNHASSSFNSTWYFTLALVFTAIVFFCMIMFMKIIPKPKV